MGIIETIIAGTAVTVAAIPAGWWARRKIAAFTVGRNPSMRVGANIKSLKTAEGATIIQDVKVVRITAGRVWLANKSQLLSLPVTKFARLYPIFVPAGMKEEWE